MFPKGSLLALAFVATSSGVAVADSQSTESCFANNPVIKVVPNHTPVAAGQGTYDQLVGARAYVPAQPGLTGEWLHAQLERRSSSPQQGSSCPLDIPGVSISVRSAGPGFWVSLAARDQDDAREVLRRTQALAR